MTVDDHRPQTRQGYDAIAAEYGRLLPRLDAEATLDVAMIDDFADRCAAAQLGPVLDAGCGTGRVSAHLAARGLEVVGVDLSPGMIEVARRTHPHLRFEVGALEDLPVPDASAGGVLAWYSLIHTAPGRLADLAGELGRVLRPSAWLLTAFQAGDGERVEHTRVYGQPVALTNYRHESQRVVTALEQAGFVVRARLHRDAQGSETTPQAILLAQRGG